MTNEIKKLANYITDIRIIGGVLITVVGVAVWVSISWTSLLNRVDAVEGTLDERREVMESLSDNINSFKVQQAVISEKIDAIDKKSSETNSLVRELLKLLKK